MTKSKAKKRNTLSPFWTPTKIGDKKEGIFEEFQTTLFGGAMKLNTGLIGLSTVLKSLFRPVAMKMKQGDKVKVVFTGTGKGRAGKPSRIFEAWLNGKKLEGMFAAASKDEIAGLFEEKKKKS